MIINIETLKCYLKFLEEVEAKNKANKSSKITGIAVFLKANNDNELLRNKPDFQGNIKLQSEGESEKGLAEVSINEDIRGRLGIFLAPTFKDETTEYHTDEESHQPFYIQPENIAEDKFKGSYARLLDYYEGLDELTEEANLDLERMGNYESYKKRIRLNYSGMRNSGTSLIAEEFTQMPPKKPNQ